MKPVKHSVIVIGLSHLETRVEATQPIQLNSVIKKLNRNWVVAYRDNLQFKLGTQCAEHNAAWDSVLLLRFLFVIPAGQDTYSLLPAFPCIDGKEWTIILNGCRDYVAGGHPAHCVTRTALPGKPVAK
jgi:hypothetical protein